MRLFGGKKIETLSDTELLEKYRHTSNSNYLGELYKRYNHLVFGVCLKYLKNEEDAKDAVMQIFEELLRDLLKFDIQNFKSWLHSKARNFCLMKLRKLSGIHKKQTVYELSVAGETLDESPMEEPEQDKKERMLTDLETAIELLKNEQKICIKKFYIEQKSYVEIVAETGYTLNKVKSYIQNGKRNLKKLMNQRINT